MTTELEYAIQTASTLPDEQQKTIAAIIIAEIADEARWDTAFQGSQSQLVLLADEALAEFSAGRTTPLNF